MSTTNGHSVLRFYELSDAEQRERREGTRLYIAGMLAKGDYKQLKQAAEYVGVSTSKPRESLREWMKSTDPANARRLHVRACEAIDDAGTSYLWKRRLVRGAINVIFSRPGRGKSTLAADLASRVTNGKAWPDGSPCDAGEVLYIKGEGTDAAIRDRLKQAGADVKRCSIIGHATDDAGDKTMIDLATDCGELAGVLDQRPDTRLLVVDTLDSLFPSMRCIDNANIRKCLWPMQELAEQYGLCVAIFAHTNKGGYSDPLDRLSGGRAIGGSARCIWYLGKLDHEADACYMAAVKANDFMPAPTLEYSIVGLSPDQPGAIRWGDENDDVTAWELDRPQQAGQSSSKADEAEAWLRDLLSGGPRPAADVNAAAESAGFGKHVLRKAKAAVGAETHAQKGAIPPKYYLCMAGQSVPLPIDP
ncbi:AAA family ATPase [Phycisphaerales bacterium AB-hyl4]|uniref:AAA family ATPase n=1 Tax=Natronomicrosphaera hydrolytica TaxID=3242702 RepID=A0ABV4UBX5_9BACT